MNSSSKDYSKTRPLKGFLGGIPNNPTVLNVSC